MDPFSAKLCAASAGSTLTALTMTPFDVVKTRLQTQKPQGTLLFPNPPLNSCCQPPGVSCIRQMSTVSSQLLSKEELVCVWENGVLQTRRINGFFDAVRYVWRAEGIRGLWKGTGTTLLIAVPSSTSYMLTYDHLLNKTLPTVHPIPELIPMTAGILARTTISTLASPLELVRTNLQSTPAHPGDPHTLKSVLSSIRTTVHRNGWRTLWRGLGPTLWRDVPFSGFYWASYEYLKKQLHRSGYQGPWVAFISGAISGTAAAILTSPMDVLKTRRQALVMAAFSNSATTNRALLVQILQTEGWKALFAGMMPRIAKIAPACGIMIGCFEGIGKLLTKAPPVLDVT